MKTLNLLWLVGTLMLFSNFSQAETWGVLGGATYYNPTNSSLTPQMGATVGLAYEHWLSFGTAYEFDALYVTNKNTGGQYHSIQVPLLLRINLLPVFDVGLGAYAAYSLDTFPGFNRTDLGLDGSLRLHIPLGMGHLFVDGRYLYGLTNQWTGEDIKYNSVQIMAGLVFHL